MKTLAFIAAMSLSGLATSAALAAPAGQCNPGVGRCTALPEAGAQIGDQIRGRQNAAPAKAASQNGPKIGEIARHGRKLKPTEARKLDQPASGRVYRLVDDRVVLIDSGSSKVLKVLGPASELLR